MTQPITAEPSTEAVTPEREASAAPRVESGRVESVRIESVRIESIDALRGFNMFWIIGGAELLAAIAELARRGWLTAISANLTEHVEWEGFHFHDMIFPLFLFIMGVTTPFSLGRRREEGAPRAALVRHVLIRAAVLFFLGLVYSGLFKLPGIENMRIPGVLQRLAIASAARP